jgi:hypothetical protein
VAAFAQPQPAPTSTGGATITPAVVPNYAYQYAAKIVCGKPAVVATYPFQVAANGSYFSAINIHNPSRTQGVGIRKKFINARPNEMPTGPTQFFTLGLEPDWAAQIDCHNRWRLATINP